MSQGHHAAAAEKLGQLARLEPGHHLAHNLLGICHMMNDLAPQAADAFARAHFLAPNNCTYLANLAKAQFLNRDLDGARQNLQQALESAPEEQRPELLALLEKCQFQGAQALPQVSEIAPPKPDKVRMPESWMDDELTRQLAPPGKAAQQVKEDARALDGVRVLHAPSEIAGNLERISRHLNKVGVQSTSLNYGLNTWAKYKCDINLDLPHLTPQKRAQVVQEVFEKALNEYDIFHFHFTRSFDANFKDLEILKDRGKKIIFSFWGSDHRSDECVDFHQACFLGHNPPAPYFNSSDYQKAQRLINRYADVMFGLACFPRGMFVPGYMDTGQWHPAEKEALAAQANKDPHKLYLVHAPSDPRYKGSAVIMQLLEECKKQGLPLEVIYVSGLELAEAKKQYALADCAVDQIATGTFGSFGSEMMLWETPILIYQDECLRKIRRDPPVIHVTKDSFVDQVARCLEMKKSGELAQLGRRSRKWVLSHLEITTHGLPVYLKVYRLLMENRSVPQYFNLDWQQQDAMMAAGVKSDFYRYMTDHRIYEEIGIPVPSRDQRLYN
jgi:tetratricopeptide (TPR) repeat protein